MTNPVSRRSFVTIVAGTGAGLVLGLRLDSLPSLSHRTSKSEPDWTPNAWLRID